MARSGSYDFILTRDDIINQAARNAGIIGEDQTLSTTRLTQAGQIMNMMIRVWQAEGIGLWKNREVVLIPQADTVKYYLGSDGDSAYGSYSCLKDDFVKTEVATAMVASGTSLVVDSATGISSGYTIGIETDNGDMHWDTVDAISGTTITLGTGVDYACAVDNHVYFATDWGVVRPMELIQAWVRDANNIDVEIEIMSIQEYRMLANKTTEGKPNSIAFDPKLDYSRVYLWPEPDNMQDVIYMIVKYPMQDFDASTDNADFPTEWTEALVYNLAIRLCSEYGRTPSPLVTALAMQAKESLMGFDREQGSLKIRPRARDYRYRR